VESAGTGVAKPAQRLNSRGLETQKEKKRSTTKTCLEPFDSAQDKLRRRDAKDFKKNLNPFVSSLKIRNRRGLRQFKRYPSTVSFQHGVLESRLTWMSPDASTRTWMPAIHGGMTKIGFFTFAGERKLRDHFVVKSPSLAALP
jgi:hypothetical protein